MTYITECKQADVLLQQQKELLQTILDHIPVMICFYNSQGKIQWINREVERVWGWSLTELQDIDVLAELYPDPAYRATVIDYMKSVNPGWRDFTLRVRGGSYLEISWANVQLSDGTCIGIGQDITERKQAEQQLRQREYEFRALAENTPDVIVRVDKECRYLYVNPSMEKACGIAPSAFIGKTNQELGFPDDLCDLWYQSTQEVIVTGEERQIEYSFPSPQGITHWFSRIVPEFTPQGSIETVLVVSRDITQLKQTQESLCQSEERLRLLTDALPVCISYVDREQRYRFVNKTYETWFNCQREEILGKSIIEFIGAEAHEIVKQNFERVFTGEQVTYEAPMPYLQGKSRDVRGILLPEINANQQVTGCYVLITDISEQQIALRNLKKTEEKLRYRLTLETAVTLVSRVLATYDQADFNYVLQLIGVAVQASRAYIVRFDAKTRLGSMIYEWCDGETSPNQENFQNMPLSHFPWWMGRLENNQNVVIEDVAALPPEAEAEKRNLQSTQVNTVLAIPIFDHFGQLWGNVGFDATGKNQKIWLDEDAQMLRVVGDMIYRHYESLEAKKELQTSEELYSGIFNNSAEAIFLVKVLPDGRFIYETMNHAYEQATGITVADFVGKTPARVFPPKLAAEIEANYRTCQRIKETILYEKTLDLPRGKRTWRVSLVPIIDSQGKVIRLQGSASDITEEKKALEEQLRYSRYQRLLATLTLKIRQSWEIDVILQTAVIEIQRALQADRVLFYRFAEDGTGKVVNEEVIPGFPVMLNQEIFDRCCLEKCQGKYYEGYIQVCSDVATAQYDPCYQNLLEQYQIRANVVLPILMPGKEKPQKEARIENSELRILNSELRIQNSELRIENSELRIENSQFWGLFCVQQCRDKRNWTNDEINLLKQLSDQLSIALAQAQLREKEIKQRQELARSNSDLENFAYMASHDLRQPLQIIGDFAILLQRRYQNQLDERADRFIEHIVGGVKRLDRQIQDLLEYSRVGSRGNPLELTDCNLVLQEALHNLQIEIRNSQAVIILRDNLPTLKADASQLSKLFQNLISNAIKYQSEASPVIKIGAVLENDHWLFSVRDNGIGIESRYSERIFQIFQRLHTQEEYPGTGIGLAICQRIIQRHGGRIWVNSQLGQGSTFYFLLPI